MILYLTLHKRYISKIYIFVTQRHYEEKLRSLVTSLVKNFKEPVTTDNTVLRESHLDAVKDLTQEKIFKSLNDFDKQLKHQPKFLRIYMQMFEILLLFT